MICATPPRERSAETRQTVVFDVDGVLIDPRFPAVLRETLGIDTNTAATFFHGPFRECLEGRADAAVELLPYLKQWGWRQPVQAFMELWLQADSIIHEPAMDFMRKLKAAGHDCVVASNQEAHRARFLAGRLAGFSQLFFSCDLKCCKPSAAFFAAVRTKLGVAAQDLLLLDDQTQNISGAQADGWQAAQYRIGEDFNALARRCQLAV